MDRLVSQKEINEQLVNNYQTKLRAKEEAIRELQEERFNTPTSLENFRLQVFEEVRLMVRTPINFDNDQLLETLKRLRKDYRRLRGFDSGPE
jgi:hypothetical protein